MMFGTHWGYWGWLAVALILGAAGALELARRTRHRRRIWLAAFLEQGRREDGHSVPYREDQRVRAIQQRLSRSMGRRRAFSAKTEAEIRKHL